MDKWLGRSLAGFFFAVFPLLAFAQTAPPPACSLTANPSTVVLGDTSNLMWQSSNATGGTITSIGSVGPSGIQGVIPTGNGTTYTGTFTGPGGTATCSVTVTTNTTYVPIIAPPAGGVTNTAPQSAPSTGNTYTPSAAVTPPAGASPFGTSGTVPSSANPPQTSSGISSPNTGLVPCTGLDCQLCSFVKLIQNLITYLLMIAIPIAAVLFAYAGFKYATAGGDPHSITKAHGIFKTAGVGFIIALSGWLIINTILNVVLGQSSLYTGGNWFVIQCVSRTVSSPTALGNAINELNTLQSTAPAPLGGGGGGIGGGGALTQVNTIGPDGQTLNLGMTTEGAPQDLQNTYATVQSQYASQIASACNSYGQNIPNCSQTIAAVITTESSGNASVGCNESTACGLMQVQPGTASALGQTCSLSDPSCNITTGTQYLAQQYAKFNDLPNALAAYNGGPSTQAGTSASGLNGPMVSSTDCPGLYAWQCGVNAGKLVKTQTYVADVVYLASAGKTQ